MKVLTLTIQHAKNMGAQLQCYALSAYLNSLDNVECQVIRYYPERYNVSWKYLNKPRDFMEFLLCVYRILRIDQYISFKRKNKVMQAFIDKYIPLTPNHYFPSEIQVNPPKADVYVCGSDQIWNFQLRKDFAFLFDFVKDEKAKKIAYSASMADPWTEEECMQVKPLLNDFDAIAIRENGNLKMVNDLLIDKKARVVADPVFLLGKDHWQNILRKPQIDEPYIFCYFLGVNDLAVRAVEKLRKATGYKVVHLNLNNRDKFNSDYNVIVADPCDFLGYIAYASIIFTNSFHCSAFSIIFEKNFKFVPKNFANERIYSLQENFKLGEVVLTESQIVSINSELDLVIDYSIGRESGRRLIDESKQFLNNALYGK